MRKILTIIGPTACGKSTLAVELAEKLNGEIIGLDSRQIYKGMPHGTAQPTEKEKKGMIKRKKKRNREKERQRRRKRRKRKKDRDEELAEEGEIDSDREN